MNQRTKMTKISIGSWAFGVYSEDPLPLDVVLERLEALEFDGVELGAFEPHPDPISCASPEQRLELAERVAQRGLEISAVAADFGEAGFLRTPDPSEYLDAVDRNLAFCNDVGADRLIVNPVDGPETVADIGYEVCLKRLLSTWGEAASRAQARGVKLTWEFEPCWAFNEPEQVIEIAHELAGPSWGVLYDTAHGHVVSEVGARHAGGPRILAGGQVELLERLAGTINHVHMLDSDGTIQEDGPSADQTTIHVPFGQGEIDFDRVIPALRAAAPDMEWWTVDLCFWPDAWGAAAESKRFVDALSVADGATPDAV
jgi:sugar phosphate isomerase/epimerase